MSQQIYSKVRLCGDQGNKKHPRAIYQLLQGSLSTLTAQLSMAPLEVLPEPPLSVNRHGGMTEVCIIASEQTTRPLKQCPTNRGDFLPLMEFGE